MYNLINIYNASNGTLFNDIIIYDKIDKDTLINTIFDEAGELEPCTSYPDLLKMKIEVFFKRNFTNFKHVYDAFLLEYQPIENYDKNSEITTTKKGTVTHDDVKDQTTTPNTTNTSTIDRTDTRTPDLSTTETPELNDEHLVQAFDGVNPTTEYKDVHGGTNTVVQNGTDTNKIDGTTTDTQTGTVKFATNDKMTDTHDTTDTVIERTHGNIGVTTSQQMLQSEIDLWTKFNPYKAMADYFIKELMITVF